MAQFHRIKKYLTLLAGMLVLGAFPITSFAQERGSPVQKDSLLTMEYLFSKTPQQRYDKQKYVFRPQRPLSDTLRLMSGAKTPQVTEKKLFALSKAFSGNNAPGKPGMLLPVIQSPQAGAAINFLKGGATPKTTGFNSPPLSFKSPFDTIKKPALPAVKLLPDNTSSLVKLPNPNPLAGQQAVQALTSPGALLLQGAGIGTTGKDQMNKLAALRSQLISESISKNISSFKHTPFSSSLSIENDFQYQPVLGAVNGKRYVNILGVNGSLAAFGIPLSINVSNSRTAFGSSNPLASSLFKFGFSPSMFSGLLKSDLQQYTDLKNSVFHGFNYTDYIRQTIVEKVSSLESDVTNQKKSPFTSYLTDPSKLQDLIKMPDKQVRQQLDDSVNGKYLATLKKPNADEAAAAKERLADYQKADSLAIVISAVKAELKKNNVSPDQLLQAENFLTGKTSPAFNSSETAGGMFTKKSGNGFQSLFSGIKDLRIGSFGTQVPGGTGEDAQLMNGANLGIKVGDYPLTFGYGSLNDVNSVKDASYTTSVYASPKNISYLGAEMKKGMFGNVKVAVVSSFNGQSNDVHYSAPTLPGNAVAVTVTKAIKVDKVGNFSFDVSKSGTLFSSSYQPGSEALLEKKAGANYNLSTNLFQAVAFGFTHNLDIPALQASDNVYFNYAGLGYQNPANNGYSGATMKFGGNLRKSFYQHKLLLNFRTDFRSMPLSYTTNDKWKNYQVQLDSRYQVNTRLNVSLKYIEAATDRTISGTNASVYNSKKIELSGNNTFKIGKYITTSHLSVSSQSLTNTYESASGSSLLNVNYAQSLVLKNSSLTATVFYNKELASYILIGDMLTSDLTYQFTLFKNLQLASGVTYLNNNAVAKQAGIRQGLQFVAGKHFDINASVDLRKNLITPQYADLYAACRAELAVKYSFKTD